MPHVIIKLWPGKNEEQKQALTARIAQSLIDTIQVPDSSISISIEEVPQIEWKEKVYDPEIKEKKDMLYKEPGYEPGEKLQF